MDAEKEKGQEQKKRKGRPVGQTVAGIYEPLKKIKRKKKYKKTSKRPGVIKTILYCLRRANEENPTNAKEIFAVLKRKFPDRNPIGMRRTLSFMPFWFTNKKSYKINVDGLKLKWTKDGTGYWAIKKIKKAKNV